MRWKITVKTFEGHILKFTVNTFKEENDFIIFKDERTGGMKQFYKSQCQIEEVLE